MSLHIAGINYESTADAVGVSTVIFFSGCKHHCDGCHSVDTWDFNYGTEVTDELIASIREEIKKRKFVKTLVLSGGDPFYSAKEVNDFLDKLDLPRDYSIWGYTGFTMGELNQMDDENINKLLDRCDHLVDGPFIKEQRDITLKFKGSSNQDIWEKDCIADEWLRWLK